MARIAYAISGEGWGHVTRSKAVIEELEKNHAIHLFGGGKAYKYFKNRGMTKISSLYIHYKNGSVSDTGTLVKNVVRVPWFLWSIYKAARTLRRKKIALVVSDYEPFTSHAALLLGIPLMHISNQFLLTHTHLKTPKKYFVDKLKTNFVTRLVAPGGRLYITTTFDGERPIKGAACIPPPLRREILDMQPEKGGHVLVYQTSRSDKKLVNVLKKSSKGFIVYGYGRKKATANVRFKDFNETEFYHDLATASAVITNGGHSLISEALYLGKPILSIPVKKQFEQICNAWLLERHGYGMMSFALTPTTLHTFLGKRFKRMAPDRTGAQRAVALIENELHRVMSKKNIKTA